MADHSLQRKQYLLVGHQRTGTHYLGSMLRAAPDVFQYDEVLMPTFTGNYGAEGLFFSFYRQLLESDWNNLLLTDFTVVDRVFKSFFDRMSSTPLERVIGYDIKIDQLNCFPRLYGSLPDWGFHIVHVIRRNYLARIASHEIMNQRVAQGEIAIHTDKQTPTRLRLDVDRTIAWMLNDRSANQHLEGIFGSFPERYMQVVYEDVAFGDQPLLDLLRFIGSEHAETVEATTIKQASEPLSEIIENYEEIINEISRRDLMSVLSPTA